MTLMALSDAKRSISVELGGIIDKEPDLLAVFLRKMLLRHLKGL